MKTRWLLALDLASSTGYALYKGNDVIDSGIIMLGESNLAMGDRLSRLITGLNGIAMRHEVPSEELSVVCERMHLSPRTGQMVIRFLAGLSMFAEYWTHQRKATWLEPVAATTIKKHAANLIGDEKMDKKGKRQTMEAARRLLQRAVNSDDEADAVVLGSYAIKTSL